MSRGKGGRILLALMFLFVVCAMACKNDVSGPNGGGSNLIQNPSFEAGDNPTFAYWNLNDTLFDTIQHFSEDVPLLGGNWSLGVIADGYPSEGFARYYITGESIRSVYHLTVWAKALSGWNQGSIALGTLSQGQWHVDKQIAVTSGNWEMYTLEDTVRLFATDTFVVHLSAGSTEVISGGRVLFDEVKLEKR